MVLHETRMQLGPYEESMDFDAYPDILDLTKSPHMDHDVRYFYAGNAFTTPPSSTSVESNKKRRDIDDENDQNGYHEEVNDPGYVYFLENLREHGHSYILEYEEDGVPIKIKYEGNLSGDEKCDVGHVRKLRSAAKNIDKPSDQTFAVEDQQKREMGKKQANKLKSKKENNAKSSDKLVCDPDYEVFIKHTKISQSKFVFKFEGRTVVYDDGGKKNVGKKDNDVNIIDSKAFFKKRTLSFSSESMKDEEDDNETEYSYGSSSHMESLEDKEETSKKNKDSVSSMEGTTDFRAEVIADLRKPYNEQEHDGLLQFVEHRRQEERHLDLRNGRERSYSTKKTGKSYLDYYPAFRQKLALVQHDKLKCLNLLRGFYLFLQQSEPPFCPWDDKECCAITGISYKQSQRLPP